MKMNDIMHLTIFVNPYSFYIPVSGVRYAGEKETEKDMIYREK